MTSALSLLRLSNSHQIMDALRHRPNKLTHEAENTRIQLSAKSYMPVLWRTVAKRQQFGADYALKKPRRINPAGLFAEGIPTVYGLKLYSKLNMNEIGEVYDSTDCDVLLTAPDPVLRRSSTFWIVCLLKTLNTVAFKAKPLTTAGR